MKLSRAEVKEQKELFEQIETAIQNDIPLTPDEIENIYEKINIGYIGDVTINSAYFTPLDMAMDAVYFTHCKGVTVDMCAGVGVLSYAARIRDSYERKITNLVCIERNPDYLRIGKKLLPEADWILGDIFDKNIWDGIIAKYGKVDAIISNPPFGKVSKTEVDRSWLKYKGAELDIAAIEVALKFTNRNTFILPQGSSTFRFSGRHYYEDVENRKVEKLKKDTGLNIIMYCDGVDTTVYEQFKNTKVLVEVCDISVES